MKYIIVLADGMADLSIESLGHRTPLEVAKTPGIDTLVPGSMIGLTCTVPEGMNPGSDVANLSVFGFDPLKCYTGRSPLEALSMGIDMSHGELAVRCNLVTLSDEDEYEDKTMLDYSAGEISSAEAAELISFIDEKLGSDIYKFHPGVSYRHCLMISNGKAGFNARPPHDISDKAVKGRLPDDEVILSLMKQSYKLLKDHPVNIERIKRGQNPANSIWLWGEGYKPDIEKYIDKFSLTGTVISAVDLIKGIGIAAGLDTPDIEGATGTLNTNYKGKLEAGIKSLIEEDKDFLYMHLEGPDECGHHADIEGKILAIERIDELIIKPLIEAMNKHNKDFCMLIMPDHPTPIALKTHSRDAVPFLLYRTDMTYEQKASSYDEKSALASGVYVDKAHKLIEYMLNPSMYRR